MGQFFIRSLEIVLNLLLGLVVLIGIFLALRAGLVSGLTTEDGQTVEGPIAVLLIGALFVLLFGGIIHLTLGISNNTRRTAEALERIARQAEPAAAEVRVTTRDGDGNG